MEIDNYNDQVAQLDPPPIPTIQQAAKRYSGHVGPLIDLSQAVPGYQPPDLLLNTLARDAGDSQNQGYGNIEGVTALRNAYAVDTNMTHNTTLSGDNVMITAGCNQAFFVAALTVAKPGESVVLVSPWYFNHQTSLAMLGINVRSCSANKDNGFIPELTAIEAAIEADVRAVVIVTPNNPTGAVYPEKLVDEIYELCVRKGIWLIIDETYQDFLPEDQDTSHQLFHQPINNHLIAISSFSKSYCIPGQRLGAAIASPFTISQMAKVMDNLQICAPVSAQKALASCMPELRTWRMQNRQLINTRASVLKRVFESFPGWKIESLGAYFAYISCQSSALPSTKLAETLASDNGVVTLPGTFFGKNQQQYLRIAFANVDAETIQSLSTRMAI